MDRNGNAISFASSHDKSSEFIKRYTSFSTANGNAGNTTNNVMAMDDYPAGNGYEEEEFCTETNIEQRLKYLNEEVTCHGFPRLLDNSGKLKLPHLLNCMYEILQRQTKHRQTREEIDAKQVRIDSDNDYLVQSISKLKDSYESAQREICILKLKEKQALTKCSSLQAELKSEREEAKRMRSDMQHKLKQFLHESRRREKEATMLKERLQQAISSKVQTKIGLEALRSLQKATGKRGTWGNSGKDEENRHRHIMLSHEERKRELMAENLKLRNYLSEVQSKAVNLIQRESGECGEEDSRGVVSDEENTDPAAKRQKKTTKVSSLDSHIEMPIEFAVHEIDKEFEVVWEMLKSRSGERAPSLNSPDVDAAKDTQTFLGSEVGILRQELAEYKDLVEKQEAVLKTVYDSDLIAKLERSLNTEASPGNPDRAKRHEVLLKEERKNFETERERFTEYALNLCREKEDFEKERTEFYRHSISTPVIAKADAATGKNVASHSKPSVVKTPHSHGHASHLMNAKSPTTAELYKFISLATDNQTAKNATVNTTDRLNGSYLETESNEHRCSASNSADRNDRHDEHIENVRKAVEHRNKTSPDKS